MTDLILIYLIQALLQLSGIWKSEIGTLVWVFRAMLEAVNRHFYTATLCRMKTASKAPFGSRDVPEHEKSGLVRGVFASVAQRYDVMNDLMSGGVHRLWKDAMVEWLNPQPQQQIVDVAGGTGDVALRIADLARRRGGAAKIVVCDASPEMITE